jgi:hypothetical protein
MCLNVADGSDEQSRSRRASTILTEKGGDGRAMPFMDELTNEHSGSKKKAYRERR